MFDIAKGAGEQVAQGVMPFGCDGTCGYSRRVPDDLVLSGDDETFTVTIRYDTGDLYGKIEASRTFVVTEK